MLLTLMVLQSVLSRTMGCRAKTAASAPRSTICAPLTYETASGRYGFPDRFVSMAQPLGRVGATEGSQGLQCEDLPLLFIKTRVGK